MRIAYALILSLACFSFARAEVQTKLVEYRDGGTLLQGFVAWNTDQLDQPAPGVLVVHQWLGVSDYEKHRCEQLAELGFVAFALDIYGHDVRPSDRQAASKVAEIYKSDRELYRRRLTLGLEQLRAQPGVATDKIAAIGYCFGGTGVLELARSGADILGGVSFHGGLDSPSPEDGKNITASLLICHGADDPFVSPDGIEAMKTEFTTHGVDWQMIYYSNAVHSFTQPMAGNDNSQGAAYNAKADERSWKAMQLFFDEIFSSERPVD